MPKEKVNKQNKAERTIFIIVSSTMLLSFLYAFVRIFTSPTMYQDDVFLVKSDYILMSLQAFGGLLLMLLPTFIEKRWKIDIPSGINIFLLIFLYAAIILGEFRRFYFNVPGWDKMLHIVSGAFLAMLSFSVISVLNGYDIIHMNPLLVAIFTFCFAVTLGVLWEFYEFAWDSAANLNMQKYANVEGIPYEGREALQDTMGDLIVDSIGAFAVSVFGYFAVKFDKLWIHKLIIKKQIVEEEVND